MTRKYCIGGNWKCNPKTKAEVDSLCKAFAACKFDHNKVEVIICPTGLHAKAVMDGLKGSGIEVGIQNLSKTDAGAFTGEVSAAMAADAGYTWCLIGHSERRTLYGETDADTVEKLKKAQDAGLKVMFCIGETLQERETGVTDDVNKRQLADALPIVTDWDKFVIAYEPVWAIGTGKVATPEQAQETQEHIRKYVSEKMGAEIAAKVRIQYGGSASPGNIEGLASKPDIDGFLVGGASLKPEFTKMIEHLSTH
jgi:triosephosphate isomerase